MISNYQELVTSVKRYLQRTDADFEAMIPVFVQLAQNRITKELKILNIENVVTTRHKGGLVFEAATWTLTKPADWLSSVSLVADFQEKVFPLEIRTAQYIQTLNGMYNSPLYYADFSTHQNPQSILLSRFENPEGFNFSLTYYSAIATLSGEQPRNIILDTLPQLFLYATLLETASFLREDERLQTWMQYYEKMKEAVAVEDIGRIHQSRGGTH